MDTPDICVIIVNYGTADLAIEAVESVLDRSEDSWNVHVHLVDNASPGDDAAQIASVHAERSWSGQVTLHLEDENHGFGRGNNLVLEAYQRQGGLPDKVFLLNPDARLENNAIDILAEFLDQTPEAGFAGASTTTPDGNPTTAAFRFPNAIYEFSRNLNFGPIARLLKKHEVPLAPPYPKERVDWVCGAAVMAKREALQQANFFDPVFFLYFEEVDLMRQAALEGWETWHIPDAVVIHAEAVSTGVKIGRHERRRLPSYWYASWLHYFRKNHGRSGALIAAAAYLSGYAGQQVIAPIRGRSTTAPKAAFRDFLRLVVLPLLRHHQETASVK